jgi:hypothetical protein
MLYYYIGTYTRQLFRLIIVSIDILEVPNPSFRFGISSGKRIVAMRNTGRLQTTSETQAYVMNHFQVQFTVSTVPRMFPYLNARCN